MFGEYVSAWLVYLLSAVGLLVVCWRICRGIPWVFLRRTLLVTAAVVLLTPAVGVNQYWAPAWVIGMLELLFTGLEETMPAFQILMVVWLVALLAYILLITTFFLLARNKGKASR